MLVKIRPSAQTRRNWLADVLVFIGGLVAALSGIYFLFVLSGGYQGGRNPLYGVTILFERHTWDAVHTWSGVLMIAAAVVHLALHWQWVTRMSRRVVTSLRPNSTKLSKGAKLNVALDALVAVSFSLTAISGIYLLFAPSGSHSSDAYVAWDLCIPGPAWC